MENEKPKEHQEGAGNQPDGVAHDDAGVRMSELSLEQETETRGKDEGRVEGQGCEHHGHQHHGHQHHGHQHHGYEAHASVYSRRVTHWEDTQLGEIPGRPGGRVSAFPSRDMRDRWVEEGPSVIKNNRGYPTHYRARSPLSQGEAERLMGMGVPEAGDTNGFAPEGQTPWDEVLRQVPYETLMATIHGSRVYGFSLPKSDWDLTGCHLAPIQDVLGTKIVRDTVRVRREHAEIMSYEAGKFFKMLSVGSGNAIEAALGRSVAGRPEIMSEIRHQAKMAISKASVNHYLGIAGSSLKQAQKDPADGLKSALHIYRAMLTGLNLARTGEVRVNLPEMAAQEGMDHPGELIRRRMEQRTDLSPKDLLTLVANKQKLARMTLSAMTLSTMPPRTERARELDELLVKIRLQQMDRR